MTQGFPIDYRDTFRYLNESDFLKSCYGGVAHRFRGVKREGLFFMARNPQTQQDELMEIHSEPGRASTI